ncbi:Uncharacterized protein APZ42_003631 [Daphnia magna]|uniref:Uncharacterized protein n=1 Tax=Daphnia magna TaxID=35525 RepID=A0A168ELS9_9CRUS|nr:Uncharacterized protein APZ42_003631 [Daphnia magna]
MRIPKSYAVLFSLNLIHFLAIEQRRCRTVVMYPDSAPQADAPKFSQVLADAKASRRQFFDLQFIDHDRRIKTMTFK